MHATYRSAILRDDLLSLAEQLNRTSSTLVGLAERHAGTIVPNYTNGVAAQPNSYGHYLLGFAAGLDRDAQGRLYAAFDAALVLAELKPATVLLDEETVSASSGKKVHRLVVKKPGLEIRE